MDNNNVSLTISKDIVNPIVKAKIEEAVLAAMGGHDQLISKVMDSIMNQKVNSEGRVGQYSSENTHRWIDVVLNQHITAAAKEAMKELMESRKIDLKNAIIAQLGTKKGIEGFATALLSGTSELSKNYRQSITIKFDTI